MSTHEREDFILENRGLVTSVAERLGRDDPDAIQDGMVGLIRAVDAYRPDGRPFSTYAWAAIRNEILRGLRRNRIRRIREDKLVGFDPPDSSSEDEFAAARFRIDAAAVAAKLGGRRREFFERLVGLKCEPPGSYFGVAQACGVAPSTVTRRIGGIAEALILEGAET